MVVQWPEHKVVPEVDWSSVTTDLFWGDPEEVEAYDRAVIRQPGSSSSDAIFRHLFGVGRRIATPEGLEIERGPSVVARFSRLEDLLQQVMHQVRSTPDIWVRVCGMSFPLDLGPFAKRIEESRSILLLEDDWDEDGSPGYDEATWKHAVRFVAQSAIRFWRDHRVVAPLPIIGPGPDGSMDVTWQFGDRTLALNVPKEPEGIVTFFARDYGKEGDFLRGEIGADDDGHWLLAWLTR